MKLMPFPNNLVCKSAAPGQCVQQENYKLSILRINLIIRNKKITNTAYGAFMDHNKSQNMVHFYLRVKKAFVDFLEPDVY